MRQDAVTRDRRYGPPMAKRSEGRRKVLNSHQNLDPSVYVCELHCVVVSYYFSPASESVNQFVSEYE